MPPLPIPKIPIFPSRDLIKKIEEMYPEIFKGEKHLIVLTSPRGEWKYRRKQQEQNYKNVLNNIYNLGKKFTDFILMELPEIVMLITVKNFTYQKISLSMWLV